MLPNQRIASDELRDPPGPQGTFLFGCLGEMRRSPMEFFTRVAREYGGIARIRFGRNNFAYLVSDAELLRQLLVVNRGSYIKNRRYRLLARVLGEGLLLSEGSSWARQRKIAQPMFRRACLHQQLQSSVSDIQAFVERLEGPCKSGEALDIEPEFSRLSQLLAGCWIMGEAFRRRADAVAEIYLRAVRAWPEPPRTALASYRLPPLGRIIALRRAFADFDSQIREIISDYRRNPNGDSFGMIPTLVKGHRAAAGSELSDNELRDQLVTLFIAAHETSGTGACWIQYFLSRHPDVRERVRSEARAAASRPGGIVNALAELEYTERVIQEAFRLYSPIHSLSRVAIEDSEIGGYAIPQGATVIVSLYALHRIPEYWPDPEKFDPDRFLPEVSAQRPPLAYMPFAAGHRNCIGGTMAMLQSKLIAATLCLSYDLDLVPEHPIELLASTTMRPRYGMQVRVAPAPQAAASLRVCAAPAAR